jgi:hypothetical protein
MMVLFSTWTFKGRREGKAELYVQFSQEGLSAIVCYHITFLPTQAS